MTITSTDLGEVASTSITVPAGQLSASGPLIVLNDTDLDGTQITKLEASAVGYTPSALSLPIHDDETATLTLSAPASAGENAGILAGQGTVSVPTAVGADVRVALTSSDVSELTMPAEVIIPAGQTSVSFDIIVVQDALLDGAQNVTLSATVTNWTSGSGSVVVTDDEVSAITLTLDDETHEGVGTDPSAGVVTLGGVAVTNVVITLLSSDETEITVPATVTIPAGQSGVAIPGTVLDDTDLDGTQTVTLSASALGNPAVTDTLAVRDNDAASFLLSTVASPQKEGVGFPFTITARDVNGVTLPAVAGSITVSAAGDGGSLAVLPTTAGPFISGVWTASFRVMEPGGNVRLTAAGPSASTQSNSFNVNMGPRISAAPSSFSVDVPAQSSKTRTLTLSNSGLGPLMWSAAGSQGWLTASPASGSVPQGQSVTVTVTFNAATVPEGTTYSQLNITSDDTTTPTFGLPVTLNVTAPVASFVWDAVPSPQRSNAPFPVTVTAKDAGGATVTGFEGTVALSGGINGSGLSQTLLGSPAFTNSGNFGSFTAGYSFTPSSDLLVTAARTFSGTKVSIWTNTGQSLGSTSIAATAGTWSETPFASPIELQAGVTYRVGLYTGGSPYFWRNDMVSTFPGGTINQGYEISGDGFPTVTDSFRWFFVDLRYTIGTPVALAPDTSVAFSSGVWTGDVAVLQTASSMALYARDGAGHAGASNTFDVTADGTLGITLASQVSEGAGTLVGTVTVTPAPVADVVVKLSSSVAGAAVPAIATVTVPAGSTSAPFTLNIVDDATLDGPQTTQIGAVSAGYVAVTTPLVVADDEGAVLTINLAQSSCAEGVGVISGTITSDKAPVVPVTIALTSSDTTEATLPASVTLAAGATSAAFSVTIINDTLVDGDQSLVLTAAVAGWAGGTKNLTVTDNEARTLTFMGLPASISEGAATLATSAVSLTGQAVAPVTVTLTSSDSTALPTLSVTIPAGASSAVFNLDPVDDTLFDGTQNVTLTATAATFTDRMANVAVLDDDVHHFALSTVQNPQKEGVGFAFTATAKDINDATITTSVGGPVNLTATGDGGALSVLPGVLTPFSSGVWTGNVRVMSPDTNVRLTAASPTAANQSNAFNVGIGPRVSVNPASYALSVAQKITKTRALTVGNTGAEPLNWSATTTSDIEPTLDTALAGINARHGEITALIPNRFDFTEGVTGTVINDGGGAHMYHGGNYLGTSLAPTASITYSDNAILPSTAHFGTGGQYFTRKVPGLFVLAADMSGVTSFTIAGSTGNHTGVVEGSILTATRGSKTFKGFVKRARGDVSYGAESINHLIIIESDAAASHSWAATVDSDHHVLTGIGARTRLYYLLYSAVSGGNINDTVTQTIFTKFLDVIGAGGWMTVTPSSGTVAAGGSQNVSVGFHAGSLNTGAYNGSIVMTSNDALTSPLNIPATMTVTPGVDHFEWDALPSPQVVNTPVAATIRARDVTNALVTDFDGTAALAALDAGAAGETTTGAGTNSTHVIHNTSYPVHRTQSIYTPAEAGAAARLSGMAFDVATLGSPAASNFIIRLKHTTRADYTTDSSWENTSGWTTVFTGSQTLAAGWNYFTFTTLFDYNGTSNLMVDISFVNSTSSSASYVRYTSTSYGRTLYNDAYSGDPLTWSGQGYYGYAFIGVPNLRLVRSGSPAVISPATTTPFVSGIWTGNVRLGTVGTIAAIASASGASGTSNGVVTTSSGALSLSMPATLTEGQGTLVNAGTVTAASAPASALTISLESMDTSEITLPATVTLPAGQTSISFDVTVVNDTLLDGPVTMQSRALAVGYPTVTAASTVADNDTTTVTVTLPASITEIAYTTATAVGTVTLGVPAAENLPVQLASSLSRLTVPASIVIPAGQTSATFALSVPDNTIIDGTEPAAITATLAGSAPATGTLQVIDNEGTNMTLLVFYSSVSEGAAPLTSAGYVYLSGSVVTPLTISLTSSDMTELTVPATITIPAGSSQSGYFALTPVNDTLQDGSQTVTVTASASGFFNSNVATVTVLDDDLHHFAVTAVPSPQIRNAPFSVSFTAKDINNVTISTYAGSAALTAAAGGVSKAVVPAVITGFSSGMRTQSVTMQDFATAAALTITEAASGATGSSNAFTVGSGALDHFTWNAIASPQAAGAPFSASMAARDVYENTVTAFTGTAQLSALKPGTETTSGTSAGANTTLLTGSYDDARTQSIYQPAEVGGAQTLNAISFNVTTASATPFTNFTVRMKPTAITDFAAGGSWESTGWTTVYSGAPVFSTTGWKRLPLTRTFAYDGLTNLLVDVVWDKASSGNGATVQATNRSPVRSIYAGVSTTSGSGNPLGWSFSSPSPTTTTIMPNIRFERAAMMTVQPATTSAFNAGSWTGQLTVPQPASGVRLMATSGTAASISSAFDLSSFGTLSLALASTAVEGAAPLTSTLNVTAAPTTDLVVSLTSSNPTAATVPATVTILAGQTSAVFPVTIVNDALLNGTRSTVITVSAAGYDPGASTLTVTDNETTTITLIIPAVLAENTTPRTGTIIFGAALDAEVILPLTSSDTTELTVPASVTIPAGSSAATFVITPVDDAFIDLTQTVTVSTSMSGWTGASATIQITDNEPATLSLSFATSVNESQGTLPATLTAAAAVQSATVFTLTSADTTEVTVPATATMAAGTSSITFPITIVNDTDKDGSQTFAVSASATGFTSASRDLTVTDDDVHNFLISTVPSPQIGNVPFNVTFTARDVNNVPLGSYTGSPALSAANGITPLTISPASLSAFNNGVKTAAITLTSAATAAVITVTDAAAGASGASSPFTVNFAPFSKFGWSAIASPQRPGTPFAATITAQDTYGNTLSGYTGTAALSMTGGTTTRDVGTSLTTSSIPINTIFSMTRTQQVHLASEIGAAGTMTSLAFNVTVPYAVSVTDFTIRLKHTTRASYSGTSDYIWESSGFTTVYQGNPGFSVAGYNTFTFTTPFAYDGTSNLMVDMSYRGSSTTAGRPTLAATTRATTRTISYYTSSGAEPLTWTGLTPAAFADSRITDLRLGFVGTGSAVLSPTTTGAFVNGVWTGNVSISSPGAGIALKAADGAVNGTSNAFNIVPPPPPASLAFSSQPSRAAAGQTFPVTITAYDGSGNVAVGHTAPVSLSLVNPENITTTHGAGLISGTVPLYTAQTDCRSQIVYKKEELGQARRLTGLALNISTTSAFAYNNFTLRLKHTSRAHFNAAPSWEGSGWTVVWQGTKTFDTAGWVSFTFSTPFDYNGTDHLMLDVSFDNTSSGTSAWLRRDPTGYDVGMMFYYSPALGDPLTWSGNSVPILASIERPQLRLFSDPGVTLLPASTGTFMNGVWSGNLTVSGMHPAVVIKATAAGFSGMSNPIMIGYQAPSMLAEPAFTGATTNQLAWNPVAGPATYTLQRAAAAGFDNPTSMTGISAGPATFSGLQDGVLYYYRVSGASASQYPAGLNQWSQTLYSDFTSSSHSGTSSSVSLHDVALAASSISATTWTENFDGGGSVWTGTIFSQAGGTATMDLQAMSAGPATVPSLPVNTGGDMEGRIGNATGFGSGYAFTPANKFADGSIEGYLAPENAAAGAGGMGAFMLRAGLSAANGPQGYAGYAFFGTSTVSFGIYVVLNGITTTLGSPTFSSALTTGDNLKLRLSAQGNALTLQVWKVSVSGGVITETPIVLESGSTSLVRTDTTFAAGSAGVFGNGTGVRCYFDDITVVRNAPVFISSGTVTSPLISPSYFNAWGSLAFTSDATGAGTSLSIDVLNAAGSVVAANVANGANLNALPAVASQPSIKLRANLATSSSSNSPYLRDWTVGYVLNAAAPISGLWSNVVSSTQDATPPVVSVPNLHTSSVAAIIAGTAIDAVSGVGSVTVAGTAATSSDAFATWTRAVSGLTNGANSLSVTASDNAVPANTTTVTAMIYRIATPSADADGDGISDLIRHGLVIPALSSNPHSMLPFTAVQTDGTTGRKFLTLDYRRRIQRAGLTYTVETSPDMKTWSAVGGDVIVQSVTPAGDGITETVRVRITPALDVAGEKFVRLSVTVQ